MAVLMYHSTAELVASGAVSRVAAELQGTVTVDRPVGMSKAAWSKVGWSLVSREVAVEPSGGCFALCVGRMLPASMH